MTDTLVDLAGSGDLDRHESATHNLTHAIVARRPAAVGEIYNSARLSAAEAMTFTPSRPLALGYYDPNSSGEIVPLHVLLKHHTPAGFGTVPPNAPTTPPPPPPPTKCRCGCQAVLKPLRGVAGSHRDPAEQNTGRAAVTVVDRVPGPVYRAMSWFGIGMICGGMLLGTALAVMAR